MTITQYTEDDFQTGARAKQCLQAGRALASNETKMSCRERRRQARRRKERTVVTQLYTPLAAGSINWLGFIDVELALRCDLRKPLQSLLPRRRESMQAQRAFEAL